MDENALIRGYIQSHCPLFYLGSGSHKHAVARCLEIASDLSIDVFGFNAADGLWRPGPEQAAARSMDPIEMLDRIVKKRFEPFNGKRTLFLLEHFDLLLENGDPFLLTRLRLIADSACNGFSVILMGRAGFSLPGTIGDIPQIKVSGPSREELAEMVSACDKDLSPEKATAFSGALSGLSALQCENLLALSLAVKGGLDPGFIRRERNLALSRKGMEFLRLTEPEGNLDDVGGLDALKDWLRRRGRHFDRKPPGSCSLLPQPKGVLLTGPPGCGKSFLARSLAGSWGVNLIRLDPARLFRSFVGETEQNFISVFEAVEHLAPAVLCIDEFEKLFSRGADQNGDGGVLSRVLALMLDFLESRRDGIFVCATTNAIANLPQEILRPGRFDAVFFVDLPNRTERAHILDVMLEKYGLRGIFRLSEDIIDATEGFSGAEMEQALAEALYETEEKEMDLNRFMFLSNIKKVVPLARTLREDFELMRKWYLSRVRPASNEDTETKGRSRVCPISRR